MTIATTEGVRGPVSRLPVGQEWAMDAAVWSLRRGRVAQAQLIVGPPDAGVAAFAEVVAMAQFCERPASDGLPCGACRGCEGVLRRTHPDVHWTTAEGRLGIDEARAIVASTHMRPVAGVASVFVVEGCERLTGPAAAALLKTLEDPPGPALFLFLASSPEQLEPTLRSRCLPVRLRPMPGPELAAWLLHQRTDLTEDQARVISQRSDGWPLRALALAERRSDAAEPGPAQALVSGLLSRTPGEAVAAAAALSTAGVSPALALAAVRDALVHGHGLSSQLGPASVLEWRQIEDLIVACPPSVWARAIPDCLSAVEAADANVNSLLNWHILFIRLQRLRRACYASRRT